MDGCGFLLFSSFLIVLHYPLSSDRSFYIDLARFILFLSICSSLSFIIISDNLSLLFVPIMNMILPDHYRAHLSFRYTYAQSRVICSRFSSLWSSIVLVVIVIAVILIINLNLSLCDIILWVSSTSSSSSNNRHQTSSDECIEFIKAEVIDLSRRSLSRHQPTINPDQQSINQQSSISVIVSFSLFYNLFLQFGS